MKKRIITAIVLIILFVPMVILSGWFYTALASILSVVAGYELLKMMENETHQFKRLKYIAPIWNGLTILTAALYPELVLPVAVFVCLVYLSLGVFHKNFNVRGSMKLIFTYVYSGLCLTYLYLLRNPFEMGYINAGFYRFAYLALIVMLTDIFALTVGLSFGKHKLCPEISPKKTIEGAIGGLCFGALCGIAFYFIISKIVYNSSILGIPSDLGIVWEILIVIFISVFLSLATQIGDLVASKIKREYNIKDYGTIFPGHGGVLDRFDSMIFAGALFHVLLAFLV